MVRVNAALHCGLHRSQTTQLTAQQSAAYPPTTGTPVRAFAWYFWLCLGHASKS